MPEQTAEEIARVAAIFTKLDSGRDGFGHMHDTPGIWDNDSSNGERAGKPCEWCAEWSAVRALLAGEGKTPHARAGE